MACCYAISNCVAEASPLECVPIAVIPTIYAPSPVVKLSDVTGATEKSVV